MAQNNTKTLRRLTECFWLRGLDLNQRPSGYAYHLQLSLPFRVCGLDFLFTPFSSESGCLPLSLYTFLMSEEIRLSSGLPSSRGFPEFDRVSRATCVTRSPLQDEVPCVTKR